MSRICLALTVITLVGAGAALGQDDKNVIRGYGKFVDPDKDCTGRLEQGKLIITVPGKDHDLGAERNQMSAPRVVQELRGDFIVQVRVTGEFKPGDPATADRAPFNGAGILIMKDEATYIRLERATFHRGGQNFVYTSFEMRHNGEVERFANATDFPLDESKDTFLRLERRGDKILAAVSQERDKWSYLEAKMVELPAKTLVGLAAVNTSTRQFAPHFDEFRIFREVIEQVPQKNAR